MDIRNKIFDEEQLERVIADLVRRKNELFNRHDENSAQYRWMIQQLAGIRYSYEKAGGIIESLDPNWGEECTPP